VEIQSTSAVSQPNAMGTGTTATTTNSRVSATESAASLRIVDGGANLEQLVAALNALGASPRDLVDILQAIRSSGAMNAEIEIQ
jgi:flagellar P-ring protein precursor FlgI